MNRVLLIDSNAVFRLGLRSLVRAAQPALKVSEAETFARSIGCSHIELSSGEARVRAHAFYERAGFSEVRKRFVKRLPV